MKDMGAPLLNDPANGKLMGLNAFKSEMIQIYANEAEYALFRRKQTNCESGNKVGELFVWQLKDSENSSSIPEPGGGGRENAVIDSKPINRLTANGGAPRASPPAPSGHFLET